MNTFALVSLLILTGGQDAPPDPLWADDILIWSMNNSTTWLGDGYIYCNALYAPGGGLYATSVMNGPVGGQGDMLRVYVSPDNGQSWSMGGFTTGGEWEIHDPELKVSSGAPDFILLFYTADQNGQPGISVVVRYQLPAFSLLDGYLIDYTNPLAFGLRSQAVARDPVSGTIWHFINDISNQLFLSKSTDDGVNWSPSEFVASNVNRPSATSGTGGRIYVAYQETVGAEDVRCLVLTESGITSSTVGSAAADAAPIPAAEGTYSRQEVGIAYHDQNGDVLLAISPDYGISWNTPVVIAQGSYPFLDIYPEDSSACMAYLNQAGTGIMASHASGLSALAGTGFTLRTDQSPSTSGPPVIRYSKTTSDADIYGLFYMGPGPEDLWYDNSYLTGMMEPETAAITEVLLSLRPNPFSETASIEIMMTSPEYLELSVFSLDGRLVERVYSGVTGGGVYQAGESLPVGVYTVVMATGDETVTLRMVKL